MNRILFEQSEIREGAVTFGGARAEHVLKVLHGEVGQVLKTGELDGKIGSSVIEAIGANGEITVRTAHDADSPPPWVDLLMAPPRPRVMKRLLPQLAQLGVGAIVLVGAKKVEKDFWGATLLKPEIYRPLLIDGLMQCGTSQLPRLLTRRNFRKFVNEEVDALFGAGRRIVAHPYAADPPAKPEAAPVGGRVVVAIGPEGGWTDEEVSLLEAKGFERYSLGRRILKTDVATVAILAQLMKEYGQ